VKISFEVSIEHQGDLDRLVDALRPLLPSAPSADELAANASALEADRRERDERILAFRAEHPEVSRADIAELFGITLVAVDRIISDSSA
jgi:hypothetical protein